MKRYISLILLFAIVQICNAQVKTDYTIYLVLNSDSQQMNVAEKKINDSVKIRTYTFSKDALNAHHKYNLSVNKNGKLIKGIKQSDKNKKEERIKLHHYSYIHGEEILSDLANSNVINYDDFMNSEFKNFNSIIRNADKIYIIDMKDNKGDSGGYKAYEVSF